VQRTTQDARQCHFSDCFLRDLEGLYHQPDHQVHYSFSVEPVATSDVCTEGEDGDFDISSIFLSHQKNANEEIEQVMFFGSVCDYVRGAEKAIIYRSN